MKRNLQLQPMFKRYNAKYFDNRLPLYRIESGHPPFDADGEGYCCIGQRIIYIAPLSLAKTRIVMIHEMAHAAVPGGHNKQWYREMERLKKTGAPVQLAIEQEVHEEFQVQLELKAEDGDSFLLDPECCDVCKEEHDKELEELRKTMGIDTSTWAYCDECGSHHRPDYDGCWKDIEKL